jgi:hypothetical protein
VHKSLLLDYHSLHFEIFLLWVECVFFGTLLVNGKVTRVRLSERMVSDGERRFISNRFSYLTVTLDEVRV